MTAVLLLLCLMTLADAFPRDGSRWHNIFHRVLDEHHPHHQVDDDNCRQLAVAAGSCLRYMIKSNYYMLPFVIDSDAFQKALTMNFGFDVFNDEAALEEFTCSIAKARTVGELKTILDSQNDFNYRQFRVAYDYGTVSMFYNRNSEREFAIIKAIGLFSLDPEGVRFFAGEAKKRKDVEIDVEDCLSGPSIGNVQGRCQALQDLFWDKVSFASPAIKKAVFSWTGISLEDKDRVNMLLCDIIKAAGVNLRSVYKVIEEYGIIDAFYHKVYPIVVRSAATMTKQLEQSISYLEQQSMDADVEERVYHELLTMASLELNFFLELERTGRLRYLE